jgi:putative methyltransferase (TIGR04325 family)
MNYPKLTHMPTTAQRITIRQIAAMLTPPIVNDVLRRLKQPRYGYFGNYETWEAARKQSDGYDNKGILEKTRQAVLKIKNGDAVYERDSVLFSQIEYSWPCLSALMWIAAQNHGVLNVIDFGGSLGSSYFQNRRFLQGLAVQWSVVEQPHVVVCGNSDIGDSVLRFYETIDKCLEERTPSAIIFSGVLQYLQEPYAILKAVLARRFRFIIIDRTTFLQSEAERMTIQKVPPQIYSGSYPCWFFNEKKFRMTLEGSYEFVAEFGARAGEILIDNKVLGCDRGFILQYRSSEFSGQENG